MTAIHETAYPWIRSNLGDHALHTLYTSTPDDLAFRQRTMTSTVAAFGGVVLLQTLQRLGYLPFVDALPPRLIQHFATTMDLLLPRETLQPYELRGFRKWHVPLIRDYLGIRACSDGRKHVPGQPPLLPPSCGRTHGPATADAHPPAQPGGA